MTKTAVIGAGVVGSAIAYRLASNGEDVLLIDADRVGGGTSSATFSMHIATRKTPRIHFELAVEGGREHLRLQNELGVTADSAWVHPCPVYEWPANHYDEELIRARMARLHEWNYSAEWLEPSAVGAREPALSIPSHVRQVACYPREYWYDADLFVTSLVTAAERVGVEVHEHQAVIAVERRPNGWSVRVATGATHEVDQVVIAAGPQTREVAGLAGFEIEVDQIPGLVLTTAAAPEITLNSIVMHPDVNIRPAPGGRFMLQSYTVEATMPDDAPGDVDAASSQRIREFAAELVPAFEGLPLVSARKGIRPLPSDGLPIAGWLDQESRIYAVAAHSAVNLAPVLSRSVTQELNGAPSETLSPFRPYRATLRSRRALDESTREMHRMFAAQRR